MVECEQVSGQTASANKTVLIDTWWNVNAVGEGGDWGDGEVLIDTWWNVNHSQLVAARPGIKVLIDTWWNVNK